MKAIGKKLILRKINLKDKDFELKEEEIKKLKKREKQKGIAVDSFAKRYRLE
jgi:hypothetical protein